MDQTRGGAGEVPGAGAPAPAWVPDTLLSAEVLAVVEAGTVAWVSPSVTDLLGWTAAQLVGRPVTSLTHPADALIVDPSPRASGRPRPLKPRRLLTAGGDYRWVAGVVVGRHPDGDRDATLLRLHDASDDAGAPGRDGGNDLDEDADWRWLPRALDASPDGFAIFRVHDRGTDGAAEPSITLQMINKVGATAYQLEPRLLRGRTLEEMAPPEVAIPLRDLVTRSTAGAGLQRRRIVVELPGWESILDVVAARLDPARVVVTWRDIATQVQAESVLMDAYARAQTAWDLLHDILESLPDPVLLVDVPADGSGARTAGAAAGWDGPTCVFLNEAAVVFLDVDGTDAPGTPLERLVPASWRSELLALVDAAARSGQRRQTRLTTSSSHGRGAELPRAVVLLVTASPTAGGRVAVVCRDVTADEREHRRLQQQRLTAEQAARWDPLTGLRNRLGLETALHQLLLACPGDRRVAVVVCDLAIESVNATLGLRRGDQLLKDTGRALAQAVPDADAVARLGSGEFVVVLAGRPPDWSAGPVLDTVRAAVDACWPHERVAFLAHVTHYLADPGRRPEDREGTDVLDTAVTDVRTRPRDHRSP